MPVKLSQALWVQRHDRSSNGGRDWKVARINNRKCTTATGRWWNGMLGQMVYIGAIALEFSVRASYLWRTNIALGNVRICRRDSVENGLVDAKILGKDRFRSMSDPVVDVERSSVAHERANSRLKEDALPSRIEISHEHIN